MAQIDTSIYNNLQPVKINSPFENAAMFSQIQNGQNQNRLAGMQFKEAERKDAERTIQADAYRQSYNPDGTQDRNKLYSTLATGGQGQLIPGLQKQYNDADASGVKLQNEKLAGRKAQIENAIQMLSATEQIMSGVRDQAGYEAVLPQLRALHDPETAAKIPAVFDPAAIERGRAQAMPLKERMAQEWKKLEYELNIDKFKYQQGNDAANRGVTVRGQNISASNAAASRAVTVRGQDMTDARAKQAAKPNAPGNWKYDAASDEWVLPPSQEYPQGQRSGSVAKGNAAKSMDYVIGQFKGTKEAPGPIYTATTGGPLGAYGRAGRVTNSQEAMRFENLREQMSTELRTLFRIPGEGALSDREQAQYGIQLPDVKYEKKTNEKILKDVQNRIKIRNGQGANPYAPKEAKDDPLGLR
ncbi:MAG: hypothetical protein WC710_14860 [Gallionella sp.]|jgi:hypothetical protein